MRSNRFVSILTVFAAAGLVHGQTYTLRRVFHAGEVDKYVSNTATKQTMSFAGAGGQPMDIKMEQDFSFKTLRVLPSGKAAEARMTTTTKMPGLGAAMAMMGGQSKIPTTVNTEGTLDWRNRFMPKSVDNAWVANAMGPGAMGQSSAMMIQLPDRPVRIGDSWSMDMPKMQMIGMPGKPLKVTLVGRGSLHGHSILKVRIAGDISVNGDMGQIMKAMGSASTDAKNPFADAMKDMSMKMKGTIDMHGTGAIDERTGKTVSMDLAMKSDLTISITNKSAGGAPMNMSTNGTSNTQIRLAGY